MLPSPTMAKAVTFLTLGCMWAIACLHAGRTETDVPFHVAVDRRETRQRLFFVRSVWVALAATFFSLVLQDLLPLVSFASAAQRELLLGILRSAGVWGIVVTAFVWAQTAHLVTGRMPGSPEIRSSSDHK